MAIKGLAVPIFANYNFDGNKVYFTDGFRCGKAVEYSFEPETADDNPLYGDNMIAEHDYGVFTRGTLTLNTTDLDYESSKNLLELKEVSKTVGDLEVKELVFDDDGKAKPKGFGIYETHQINDVDCYRALIFPRVTPKNPSDSATTKGESIEWQTKELECTVERSEEVNENYNHPWKYEAWFNSENDALEYLKTVLNVLEKLTVTSAEGTAAGSTKLTVTPAKAAGNSYKYSTSGQAPTYKQDLTEWEDWDGSAEIEVANGTTLYLAEVNAEKKAVKAGSVIVKAKAGA